MRELRQTGCGGDFIMSRKGALRSDSRCGWGGRGGGFFQYSKSSTAQHCFWWRCIQSVAQSLCDDCCAFDVSDSEASDAKVTST